MKVKNDLLRDNEAFNLMRMVDIAIQCYNMETGFDGREISNGVLQYQFTTVSGHYPR